MVHKLKHKVKSGKDLGSKLLIGKYSFSRLQLSFFILAFAGVGYLLFTTFAASTPLTKTWDTQTDFQTGTLTGTSANTDGTVTLKSTGGTPAGPGILSFEAGWESGNYQPWDGGVQMG